MRLDPLRSGSIAPARCCFGGSISLASSTPAAWTHETTGNRENLTEVWQVQWTHATTATVEAAGIHGVTLVQASEAAIRRLKHPDAADVR